MKAVFAANWRLLLFGFLMMFWSSPGQTYLISLYSGELRASFDLTHSQFGAVYSVGTLLSAGVMVWSGRLIDRMDLAKLSLIVVCLLGAGLWWMSFSTGIIALLAGIFLLRQAGQGLMTHIGGTVMVRYFERVKGKTTAFAWIGYVTAEAVLPILTIALIAWLGWRDAFRASGGLLLLIMIPAILLLLRDHHRTHRRHLEELEGHAITGDPPEVVVHWSRRDVLMDRRFYMSMPALMAAALLFTGFFFHQIHLVESKGWSLIWWGQMFALYAASSFCATLVYGPLVDRFGAVRLLPWCILPLAAGLLLLYASSHPAAGIAFLVLTGMTAGGVAILLGPFWAEVYGTRHLGAIKSVGTAVSVFASAVSPFAMGWLIDLGMSMETLALLAALYIFVSAALARLAFSPPLQPRH